jgi:threonine synthase
VAEPETIATAIRIGNPQSWDAAHRVQQESGGWFDEVTDEQLLATQKLLAEREGIFCEPASAVSLCGALRDLASGRIPRGSSVVCTLTGHGLKDPDTAIRQSAAPIEPIDATLEEVRRVIGGL